MRNVGEFSLRNEGGGRINANERVASAFHIPANRRRGQPFCVADEVKYFRSQSYGKRGRLDVTPHPLIPSLSEPIRRHSCRTFRLTA